MLLQTVIYDSQWHSLIFKHSLNIPFLCLKISSRNFNTFKNSKATEINYNASVINLSSVVNHRT
jgi:hypothetical protein